MNSTEHEDFVHELSIPKVRMSKLDTEKSRLKNGAPPQELIYQPKG